MIYHPDASLLHIYRNIDLPLVEVLTEMEHTGVLLDADRLRTLGPRIEKRLDEITHNVAILAGREINVGSSQQIQWLLFDHLGLPHHPNPKNKGADHKVLEFLREEHLVVPLLLEDRKLRKQQDAFVTALPEMINPRTGRIHPSFNNTRVETGRLSCSDPNFQQLPKRYDHTLPPFVIEVIKEIRKAVIAPPGHKIVKADQAQVEFRLAVIFGHDERSIAEINSGRDIHGSTVADYLQRPYEEIVAERKAGNQQIEQLRTFMKNVVYGCAYGQSEGALHEFAQANGLPMTKAECKRIQDGVLHSRPGIKRYIEETKTLVEMAGYVDTYFGRRMWYPDANNPKFWIREKTKREAVNAPIQGTSADVMKLTMRRIFDLIREKNMKAKFILQVHDEMCLIAPDEEAERLGNMIEETQPTIVPEWPVVIQAEAAWAQTWGDAK